MPDITTSPQLEPNASSRRRLLGVGLAGGASLLTGATALSESDNERKERKERKRRRRCRQQGGRPCGQHARKCCVLLREGAGAE
ncbi:MAG: hypothetical protein QM692_22430 [Thermomicrobiales bacterium]